MISYRCLGSFAVDGSTVETFFFWAVGGWFRVRQLKVSGCWWLSDFGHDKNKLAENSHFTKEEILVL